MHHFEIYAKVLTKYMYCFTTFCFWICCSLQQLIPLLYSSGCSYWAALKAQGSVVSNLIGMKFASIVLK